MKKTILILIVMTLVVASCKKYEEGPAISLRSKTARVCGIWTVEKMFENEIEVLDETQIQWEFKSDGTGTRQSTDPLIGTTNVAFSWSFIKDKSSLEIILTIPSVQLTMTEEWEILKLKDKSMWVKTTLYDNLYEYRLKQ